jgi:hypothetical protein
VRARRPRSRTRGGRGETQDVAAGEASAPTTAPTTGPEAVTDGDKPRRRRRRGGTRRRGEDQSVADTSTPDAAAS